MKANNSEILNRIYAETLGLIVTYGAKGWTMDTVSKKGGVAKDTLYRIIPNKEELIKSVLMQVLDEHNHKMEMLLDQKLDFFKTLYGVSDLLYAFLLKFNSEKLNQIFLEYPLIEKAINEKMEAFFSCFAVFLSDGKKSGYLKEHVDERLLIHIIHTCIMQFLKQQEQFHPVEDTRSLLNYLIEGIMIPAQKLVS